MKLPEAPRCLMNLKKMIKSQLSYARNERGNAMMLSLFIVICFVFLAFVFFDIFSTYAYKNTGQNAADAAAVAASSEAKDIYDEELSERLEEEFSSFAKEVREAAQDKEVSIREEAESRGAPDVVVDKIMDDDVTLTNEALLFFFTDAEITNIMCGAIKDNWSDIEDKANYFAQENGAKEVIEMKFPYGQSFEIFASVNTETTFVTVPDQAFAPGERNIRTEASSEIPILENVQFQYGSCH
ncbi:pilus assembly protein TadG-related protein [Salibacterium lacus]|uniref:Pilus assembly protein TadG-related protein n=1 Tax=Salibacterium lacus TaxID=1898109 RepID=A0ABW5T220_9BACI